MHRIRLAGLAALRADPTAGSAGSTAGPPVLLLPGYASSKEDYLPVLPGLAAAGLTVIALDQRGQHESAGPPGEDGYTLDAFASDVHRVVAELGAGPAHLVGHSFAGLVVRAAVIAQPSCAATVTLVSSGPAGIVGRRQIALRTIRGVYQRGGIEAVWAAIRAADNRSYPPATAEFLTRRFFANNETCLRAIGDHLLREPDRVADLAAAASVGAVPIMVVHGEADDGWPAAAQADMARRLDARYQVLPEAAHSPAAENPEALVSTLVDFWRRPGS